ncbi:hypothetical protein C8F04DRAFT_1266620 [Mycena alexandri]|uniref:DUF6532 domain-containing protein n=1 Tax=Mycena alexandri TaxID=1745969 RepID=A0AAD6WWH6_9AGAR|nr:hypothetical protein C8F04DRAFT_1266620 [Mycena alexandri]
MSSKKSKKSTTTKTSSSKRKLTSSPKKKAQAAARTSVKKNALAEKNVYDDQGDDTGLRPRSSREKKLTVDKLTRDSLKIQYNPAKKHVLDDVLDEEEENQIAPPAKKAKFKANIPADSPLRPQAPLPKKSIPLPLSSPSYRGGSPPPKSQRYRSSSLADSLPIPRRRRLVPAHKATVWDSDEVDGFEQGKKGLPTVEEKDEDMDMDLLSEEQRRRRDLHALHEEFDAALYGSNDESEEAGKQLSNGQDDQEDHQSQSGEEERSQDGEDDGEDDEEDEEDEEQRLIAERVERQREEVREAREKREREREEDRRQREKENENRRRQQDQGDKGEQPRKQGKSQNRGDRHDNGRDLGNVGKAKGYVLSDTGKEHDHDRHRDHEPQRDYDRDRNRDHEHDCNRDYDRDRDRDHDREQEREGQKQRNKADKQGKASGSKRNEPQDRRRERQGKPPSFICRELVEDVLLALDSPPRPRSETDKGQGRSRGQDRRGDQQAYKVLDKHRAQNRAVRAPDADRLAAYAQKQRGAEEVTEEDGEEEGDDDDDDDEEEEGVKKKRKTRTSTGELTPDMESFYPKFFRKVIKICKPRAFEYLLNGRMWAQQARFLNRANKWLTDAISYCQDELGLLMPEGIWEKHHDDLEKLLWSYASTFRGRVKTASRAVVQASYKIIPSVDDFLGGFGQEEFEAQTRLNVEDLITDSKFHHMNKRCSKGKINNFMAPAIPALIFTILYEGRNPLAKALPNSFRTYTPELVAAMSNALKNSIDEYSTGTFVKRPFSEESYSQNYDDILAALDDLKEDEYHWTKTTGEWAKWQAAHTFRQGNKGSSGGARMKVIID